MKILIYSASGLIGINLVKKLSNLSSNNQIYLVSTRNIPSLFYTEMGIKLENIKLVPDINKLKIEFDEIYHCGYSSQPDIFLKSPLITIEKNISITPLLMRMLSPEGSIFYMSSSEVYSGCKVLPCDETHLGDLNSMGDRITYCISKLITEKLIEGAILPSQKFFLIRVSLVYGPGVFPEDLRVMYKFIRESRTGVINIKGSPDAIRRYLYVDDFVEGVLSLRGQKSGIYNLGGELPVTILNLAQIIRKHTGAELEIVASKNKFRDSAPIEVNLTMNKIKAVTKFSQKIDLESGIQSVIKWLSQVDLK
jgi:nucleoside-diphosphate-sugar epimerase